VSLLNLAGWLTFKVLLRFSSLLSTGAGTISAIFGATAGAIAGAIAGVTAGGLFIYYCRLLIV
jgi:hypothetical protein